MKWVSFIWDFISNVRYRRRMKGGAWNKKNDKNGMLVLINHILGMHNTVHLNSSVAPDSED